MVGVKVNPKFQAPNSMDEVVFKYWDLGPAYRVAGLNIGFCNL
jgi:hypothetical protein